VNALPNQESELKELLIGLASSLTVEDAEDPEVFTLLAQLVSFLDPAPTPLPQELVEQLSQVPNPEERFTQAALAVNANTPEQFKDVADSMRVSGLLKSEDLEKMGAMARLHPYNPASVPIGKRQAVEGWTAGGGFDDSRTREAIPAMNPSEKARSLHKLSGLVKTRKSASGEREFLLHRGMGQPEADKSVSENTINHDKRSSWTPNLKLARDLASHDYHDDEPGYRKSAVASAWINEKHIHFYPNQIGTNFRDMHDISSGKEAKHPGISHRRSEHEVIVNPGHSSELAHFERNQDINSADNAFLTRKS
jgi:hypothetical protein